jgi:two-component system chemotaxis response regulator CheY
MPKTILIVDDSESIRELVSLSLEASGYAIEKGKDGFEALQLLDGREINLVITDLNMPVMDGVHLIKEIRKRVCYSTIPILLFTTEAQQAKKEEAKAAGATGWITKPFAQEKLLDVIKKIIG